jgi:hypothetical protein
LARTTAPTLSLAGLVPTRISVVSDGRVKKHGLPSRQGDQHGNGTWANRGQSHLP